MLDEVRTIEENKTRSQRFVAQLAGATLSYPSAEGEVSVLNGIDLEVEAGEIIGVMGPSGSGKSSLIALIAGLEAATGGQVSVLGTDLSKTS